MTRGKWILGRALQVGLELSQIYVEISAEPERGGDGGDDLTNEPAEVGIGGSLNVAIAEIDVLEGLVFVHEGEV